MAFFRDISIAVWIQFFFIFSDVEKTTTADFPLYACTTALWSLVLHLRSRDQSPSPISFQDMLRHPDIMRHRSESSIPQTVSASLLCCRCFGEKKTFIGWMWRIVLEWNTWVEYPHWNQPIMPIWLNTSRFLHWSLPRFQLSKITMPFKKNVDHTIHESRDFTTVYLVITHMMMTFGQKLSASAILPSDEIISSEK